MSLSLFVRKSVAFCSLAATLPTLLFAEGTLLPLDGEFGLAPGAPGDQVLPHVAISPSGGFAVWQEPDGDGFGIRAVALDSNLRPAQAPFRINQLGRGDQENPQVAILPNGGAAFVWQSGRQGFQKIVGRFLSASNTWVTPSDIAVSSYTKAAQRNPSIAVLAGGNVVVVWTSFNQRGSATMQDVYGQVLRPDGSKVGPEFTVNQFTAYNQRTPAVAALPDGKFVVAWVSEQQRNALAIGTDPVRSGAMTLPSVDVYARVFNADGTSGANEFLVNTAQTLCANPAIASNPDGSWLIAWGQVDPVKPMNRWDIFARAYSAGQSAGEPHLVNTRVYGDQFAPQVVAVSGTYLVVWTSMAQDGSQEGVFGQYLANQGSAVGTEFRVNTTILNGQKQPSIAADQERAMVVWTSYTGGAASFDPMAQVYAVPGYSPVVASTNYAVPTFVDNSPGPGGIVDPVTGLPVLDFPGGIDPGTGPVTNGFQLAQGSYRGLFFDTNGVAAVSAGYFSAQVTGRRTFSVRLSLSGQSYAASGKLDEQGAATITFPAASQLTMNFRIDLAGLNQARGTISKGSLWTASFLADKTVLPNSSAYTGTYTMLIPPGDDLNNTPAGYGFGSVKVNKKGVLVWNGTLSDGTKVVQNSAVSPQGMWPLYAAAYKGRGVVVSWAQFTNSVLGGALVWSRPALPGALYPNGFTNLVELSGSAYNPAPLEKRALVLQNGIGDLIFAGGGLNSAYTNRVQLESNSQLTTLFGSQITSFSLVPASGLFRGTLRNPETGQPLVFQGSVLQNEDFGAGFFLGTNSSGQVYLLSPTP